MAAVGGGGHGDKNAAHYGRGSDELAEAKIVTGELQLFAGMPIQ